MQVGTLVGVADAGSQLVEWQTGARGADLAQMIALLHRFDGATGATALCMVGGLSLIAGSLLLGVALRRARVAPVWAAACLPLGIVVNVVSYGAGSRLLLAASSVVLLAGLARVAANGRAAAGSGRGE